MRTLVFKSNLKCKECIARISPFLEQIPSVSEWKVNLDNPDRLLEINGEAPSINDILEAAEKAGYKLELL